MRCGGSSYGKRRSPKMNNFSFSFFLNCHLKDKHSIFLCPFCFQAGRESCSCAALWIFVLPYAALNTLPLGSDVIFSNTTAAQSVLTILPQCKIKNISKPVAPPLPLFKKNRSTRDSMHNESTRRGKSSLRCNTTDSSR